MACVCCLCLWVSVVLFLIIFACGCFSVCFVLKCVGLFLYACVSVCVFLCGSVFNMKWLLFLCVVFVRLS